MTYCEIVSTHEIRSDHVAILGQDRVWFHIDQFRMVSLDSLASSAMQNIVSETSSPEGLSQPETCSLVATTWPSRSSSQPFGQSRIRLWLWSTPTPSPTLYVAAWKSRKSSATQQNVPPRRYRWLQCGGCAGSRTDRKKCKSATFALLSSRQLWLSGADWPR